MSFFQKFIKTKEEKELLLSIEKIEMNMSNNYKDAAQMNVAEVEAKLSRSTEQGNVSDELREEYESNVKGYAHKDQKPYGA